MGAEAQLARLGFFVLDYYLSHSLSFTNTGDTRQYIINALSHECFILNA
jgi:hypothetical protein